jgi:hypothetical protein
VRIFAGLACRRFPAASEPVGAQVEAEARSTSRSAVSGRFVKATQAALAELLTRDLSELQVAAMPERFPMYLETSVHGERRWASDGGPQRCQHSLELADPLRRHRSRHR